MKKILTVVASFGIMLCLGGVYAWSIFVPELINNYGFSSIETQLVFGILIAIFPVTMIFAGLLEKKIGIRAITMLAALFFGAGYLLAGASGGNFILILIGIGVLAGIGTGLGYLAALTTPVKWFPHKKGLITGISAGGFGLAAVILSYFSEKFLLEGKTVLQIFTYIGLVYGIIILLLSFFMVAPKTEANAIAIDIKKVLAEPRIAKLVMGIFCGTFAGLLVIGNLKPIGATFNIADHTLLIGVSVFALANFTGRLSWGYISDLIGARKSLFMALTFQAVAIFMLGYLKLNAASYLALSAAIGFGFGSNFVLFAKETATQYGVSNLGFIYPYIFLGYAVAGIFGPMTGGIIYDSLHNYSYGAYIAAIMSISGAIIFAGKVKKSESKK